MACTQLILVSGFSFLVGYADIIALVRYNSFCCIMVGNLVLACRCIIVHGREGVTFPVRVWHYAAIVGCYALGVAAYQLVERRLPGRAANVVTSAFLLVFVGWFLVSNLVEDPN